MSQSNDGIWSLIDKLGELYENGWPVGPWRTFVKSKEFARILDAFQDAIPNEIREAKVILKNKEEILQNAKLNADRIIAAAENERYRLLNTSSIMKDVQDQAQEVRQKVINECEDIKMKAFNEAEGIRLDATQEAIKIKEGAQNYANQILSKLEGDLSQLYQIVANGQQYLNEMRANNDAESSQMSRAQEQRR